MLIRVFSRFVDLVGQVRRVLEKVEEKKKI
jgi:hypothetical protein